MSETSNAEAALKFAQFGLDRKRSNGMESASGPGSSCESAQEFGELLLSSIDQEGLRSILDLGCGDWNWMSRVMADLRSASPEIHGEINYEGWDILPELIDLLNATHGSPSTVFKTADICTEPIPPVDLVICRDVLFHMPRSLGVSVLEKIRASGSKFLLTTSFPDNPENTDISSYNHIEGWGFYPINLDIPPFGLCERLVRRIEERRCSSQGSKRFACLYRL